jgi:polysaccharide pyruvyl transferase WcaK-like protein
LEIKVLLVGDNSTNPNWGGRGASLALLQMLDERFQISGTVPGSAFQLASAGFGYVKTFFPKKYNWLFLNLVVNRQRRKLYDWYVRFEELCGAKDFIAHDPAETAENILRYKSRYWEIRELFDKVDNADLILIHGEGDIVFTTPPKREALFLLGMAELGLRLDKKVVFANGLLSDCQATGRNVKTLEFARTTLTRCNAVIVRDYESFEYVKTEMPEASSALVPDSLFTWYPIIEKFGDSIPGNGDFILPFPEKRSNLGKLDFSKPYICIGGSAVAAKDNNKSAEYFKRLVAAIRELGYPVYLTENCGGDSFLEEVAAAEGVGLVPVYTSVFMAGAILANARLFISGRYHPTILASLGGTPCIFLGSSGHKMHSLQKILEYEFIREFPVFPRTEDIREIKELAKTYINRGEPMRKRIKAVAKKRYEEAIRLPDMILGQPLN